MSCYCCVIGAASIHDPLWEEGDVLGTCYNCHVHACGHHADRSADDAKYLCMLCVKALLTASAFTRTGNTDYTRRMLAQTGNERLLSLRQDFRFATIDAFARSHPRMWETIVRSYAWPALQDGEGILSDVKEALDEEGIRLLAAAIVLAIATRIPKEDIEAVLLRASEQLSAEAPQRGRQ